MHSAGQRFTRLTLMFDPCNNGKSLHFFNRMLVC